MVNPCVYGYRKAVMRVRSFPLFRRFVVAIMAGLVFTLIMSWFNYTPVDQRIEHIYYYSYSSLVVGGLIYVMPIFLIIGIPVSVLLDLILFRSRVRNRIAGYLLSLIMYALGGVFAAAFLMFLLRGWRFYETFNRGFYVVLLASILASWLFLHVSMGVDLLTRRASRRTTRD
jgi:hypothetical protein